MVQLAAARRASSSRARSCVIDFWTYSCINCLRSLPYVKAWDAKYRKDGLVIIGVHAPEFAFEREPANVAKAIKDLGVTYPVALDNRYVLWSALKNNYWPAHYFVDAQGRVRYHHFGEGEYAMSERVIRQLLAEAGHAPAERRWRSVDAQRRARPPRRSSEIRSPETYIGYARADALRVARRARSATAQDLCAPRRWRSTTGR